MERLTEKTFEGDCFEYDLVNFTHKVKEFNNYDAFFAYNMAVKELGKYEDFMEEQGFQSLKDLQEKLNNAIELPKGFFLHQKVYMIPTEFNRLKSITDYDILSAELSGIGKRIHLSICKKEAGKEPFYCASFDMFNTSIFATKDEAEQRLKERGTTNEN